MTTVAFHTPRRQRGLAAAPSVLRPPYTYTFSERNFRKFLAQSFRCKAAFRLVNALYHFYDFLGCILFLCYFQCLGLCKIGGFNWHNRIVDVFYEVLGWVRKRSVRPVCERPATRVIYQNCKQISLFWCNLKRFYVLHGRPLEIEHNCYIVDSVTYCKLQSVVCKWYVSSTFDKDRLLIVLEQPTITKPPSNQTKFPQHVESVAVQPRSALTMAALSDVLPESSRKPNGTVFSRVALPFIYISVLVYDKSEEERRHIRE